MIIGLCSCEKRDDSAVYSQIEASSSLSVSSSVDIVQSGVEQPSSSGSSSSAPYAEPSSTAPSGSEQTAQVYTVSAFVGQSDDWRLLLANRNNVVEGYSPSVKRFERKYCQSSNGYDFDERAFDDAMAMISAAEQEGVRLIIKSSYRTYSKQTELYEAKVRTYLNKGYSRANAEKIAATIVAIPGTSDHNLGLAIDFNYLEQEDENKPELVWLRENGEKYGFVMRYPKGKENITGVIYEPWHFRYVGVENAKRMNALNMCLEEYVEYLSKNS